MTHQTSFSGPLLSSSGPTATACDPSETDLTWPFGDLHGLDRDDIRETAYEVFFTACRSSPGFGGGRNNLTFYSNHHGHGHSHSDGGGAGPGPMSPSSGSSNGSPGGNGGGSGGGRIGGGGGGGGNGGSVVVMTPTSRIKRALGLKMIRRSPSRRMSTGGGGGPGTNGPGSPNAPPFNNHNNNNGGGYSPGTAFNTVPASRPRRPLTSAEIMRMQMGVTEQSDNRLRKTLMRTLVGQMGRRAETIILPLELLRHLKPSEFNDTHEYHLWQRRQLKILETGLLLHPSVPLQKSNSFAMRLREIIRTSDTKSVDTSKNSDTMRTLCNSVVSLSWRSPTGAPSDVCHWADGFPLNLHIYTCLLQAIFDFRDETLVLDEVDELVELMKKTWTTLGINRPIHNLCFTWVLFQQYVLTSQTEPDLLYASHTMLSTEVANDAKKPDREANYAKLLSSMLASMQGWAERRLLHYHDYFQRGNVFLIENLLPLALSASKIMGEDITIMEGSGKEHNTRIVDSSGDRVDHYIRASIKSAFAKIIETGSYKSTSVEVKDEAGEALLQLAKETEYLASRERESFSPILKKWQPIAASVAAVTLHHCYGAVLKQYLAGMAILNSESVEVLERAGKLEKFLVQMVVEDSADCDDGGKSIVREMVPFEVDSVIIRVMKQWIEDKLKKGRECLLRARDSETWNPKSKNEPYTQSVVELMKLAKESVDEFFEIPVGINDDLVCDLAEGLEHLFQEYIKLVEACGSKQNYVPILPPLTRCNRDSKFFKLWKKATPCSVTAEEMQNHGGLAEAQNPRPSTSRGTQRLYIRLNTLHYLLSHLHSLDKTLALAPRTVASARTRHVNHRRNRSSVSSYFELTHSAIQSVCQHVSEVAAYRLIFLDSNAVFYETLYLGDVANARIRPVLRTVKQNLTLLTAILTDRAQALAMKEVMKAAFEAFLMVLLAGGCSRVFYRSDHPMIHEDFEHLKRVFCSCGEGLINEEAVEKEADIVEGVVALMGECTEQLMEDFSIVTCETSGIGVMGTGQKLPMPPTTGRWNRADPNTILRVLCHRNDKAANVFLKKSFQLAKRK
ncbi:protein unc-13 homolog [Mercurialis annua]|uniref:protein unc-13 homolog n=1 Tax=Mercurialis annua TaxID=3986 RepID=UPI00215FF193|nr:protein unc-13 homolog [Mercurialis annua]